MARYTDVPVEMKITSEMIEPAFGSIIARLWHQSQYMKEHYGIDSLEYADALENLWEATEHLISLSGLCIDTYHARMAMINHNTQIHKFIKSEIGINAHNKESMPFRRYTNIKPEVIEADEARLALLKELTKKESIS